MAHQGHPNADLFAPKMDHISGEQNTRGLVNQTCVTWGVARCVHCSDATGGIQELAINERLLHVHFVKATTLFQQLAEPTLGIN